VAWAEAHRPRWVDAARAQWRKLSFYGPNDEWQDMYQK
jgi:hypothetical protein